MSAFLDKRVLVLGGSSGIGQATASAANERGGRVTIASRSPERLAAALRDLPQGVDSAVLDVRDDAGVERFFGEGPVWDHVVICGAETPMGSVREQPMAEAHAAMDSKFWGAYRVARAAKLAETGSLTLVSGILSQRPRPGIGVQSAINAAVEALGRALALELAPVRVNTVSPGLIATPLWDDMGDAARKAMYARASAALPVRRIGAPADVASLILELAGNGFATGSTVYLDGGRLIAA
jgi:NAD(P)-dependent dehydrogenase (short-subunit alcohol dehydrogenase family)